MKQTAAMILLLAVALLPGCGAAEKAQEKAAEKAAEKVMENAIGGDADVQIDGEKYTVDYGNGAKMEVGGSEWPKEGPAAEIPELKKGIILSVITVENVCNISLEKLAEKEFDEYLQAVKDAGFVENSLDMGETEEGRFYMAENTAGHSVSLAYSRADETLGIMASAEEASE